MKNSILISIALACGLLLAGCKNEKTVTPRTGPPLTDVEFARKVFELLEAGDDGALSDMIDWEHFVVTGTVDVGAMYRGFKSEGARAGFRKSFVKSYSDNFKKSGGSAGNLSNWREQSRDASQTVVAADGPGGKVLLLTVIHADGQQKVSTFDLK